MGERAIVDEVFRDSWPRLVSLLVREFGDLDVAEEAAQDAFLEAAMRWPTDGAPRSPEAWLVTTGRRKAIDRVRRSQRLPAHLARLTAEADIPEPEPSELHDEQLHLLLGCCHPALAEDTQVALTLRIVAGLTTEQIAGAYLVSASTMGRRLSRAKAKIRAARIPFVSTDPSRQTLVERLAAVRRVIYLIFSEGHTSTHSVSLARGDLCDEAVWMAELLARLVPNEAEVRGLASLLLLIDARRASRLDASGIERLLDEQDRALWDADMISRGLEHLGAAHAQGSPGPFQLQAAIAALHATAPSFEETDWSAIVRLYDALLRRDPSPVVALNRAVAVSYAQGPDAGLELLEELAGSDGLQRYPYFHSTRGELLARAGRTTEAIDSLSAAMSLCTNVVQLDRLRARRSSLGPSTESDPRPQRESP